MSQDGVAEQLLHLARLFDTREGTRPRVKHDLRQDELAQLVGASRKTIGKALADFAGRGWIQLSGQTVLITNRIRLASRCR